MKYHIERECTLLLEAIKFDHEFASILLSRNGGSFELIADAASVGGLRAHIGQYVDLAVEGWVEFHLRPTEEVPT